MESIVNKTIVLSLNGLWMPVGFKTVKQAIKDMNGGEEGGAPPALALDIGYNVLENGEYDFDNPTYMNPVAWNEWINLPVRSFDLSISSVKMTVRVPTVLIAQNFKKMPIKRFRPTKEAIRLRDGDVCQYSGEKITRGQGNIDHVLPKDKGGKDTFENLVWCKKEINTAKGNKTNKEAGLKLIRTPLEPKPVPMSSTIKVARHTDWNHFLIKNLKNKEE